MKYGTGQSIKRQEDVRFVTGSGQFTDDIKLPNEAHGYVLRSPHAAAKLGVVDVAEALKMPGVLAVITAKELDAAGVGALQSMGGLPEGDGVPLVLPKTPQPILAKTRVRYVGAPVAFIIADTLVHARDAAEAVNVDYEPLPAVGTMEAAMKPGAPLVWDEVEGNIVYDWTVGDKKAVQEAFAKAAFVAEATTHQNRVIALSMEARAAVGAYDAGTDQYSLYATTQGANGVQANVAAILGVKPEKLRVLTTDVGGGFGMKLFTYPEYALVCAAARIVKRPVRWASDRSESFLSDTHGRDLAGKARLALDKDGKILALELDNFSDLGAYQSEFGANIGVGAAAVWGGAYKVPAVYGRVRGVFTNTMAVDAYRGAGRPEAAYMMERLMTEAARVTGMSNEEIRRRNFVSPGDLPYKNWRGTLFDFRRFQPQSGRWDEDCRVFRFRDAQGGSAQARQAAWDRLFLLYRDCRLRRRPQRDPLHR